MSAVQCHVWAVSRLPVKAAHQGGAPALPIARTPATRRKEAPPYGGADSYVLTPCLHSSYPDSLRGGFAWVLRHA